MYATIQCGKKITTTLLEGGKDRGRGKGERLGERVGCRGRVEGGGIKEEGEERMEKRG